MRRRNKTLKNLCIAGAALTLLAPLFILGQQALPPSAPNKAAEQSDSGEATFSSDTRLVPLNVTVTDTFYRWTVPERRQYWWRVRSICAASCRVCFLYPS